MSKAINKKAEELIQLLKANNSGGIVITCIGEDMVVRTCGSEEDNPEIGVIIGAIKQGTNIYDVPRK